MSWNVNQHNGFYHYGCAYPMQKRLQVVVTYLATLSIADTSRICCVSYYCVDKYIRLFQQRGTLSPLVSHNARPKKIAWWMEAYLEALVRINPTLNLPELQQLLADDFNLAQQDVPSITAITNLFTNFRITRKKCVLVARERMSHHVLQCRQMFFQWRRAIDPCLVYFFDETFFNCETDERQYGRIDLAYPCPSFRLKSRARSGKHSALAVCGFVDGVIQAISVEGNLTALLITDIIENQILPILTPNGSR